MSAVVGAALFISLSALATALLHARGAARRAARTVCADPAAFAAKRAAVLAAGRDGVHFVIDFDRTLTTYSVRGERGDSCHGVVEKRRGRALAAEAAKLNACVFARV